MESVAQSQDLGAAGAPSASASAPAASFSVPAARVLEALKRRLFRVIIDWVTCVRVSAQDQVIQITDNVGKGMARDLRTRMRSTSRLTEMRSSPCKRPWWCPTWHWGRCHPKPFVCLWGLRGALALALAQAQAKAMRRWFGDVWGVLACVSVLARCSEAHKGNA